MTNQYVTNKVFEVCIIYSLRIFKIAIYNSNILLDIIFSRSNTKVYKYAPILQKSSKLYRKFVCFGQ